MESASRRLHHERGKPLTAFSYLQSLQSKHTVKATTAQKQAASYQNSTRFA